MRIGRNLVAGLGSSVLRALIGLAVIPFYVRYLGVEGYGLIGFLATVQVVVQLLDFGLATTINREVARGIGSGEGRETRTLLHTLAVIYWIMASVIAIVMVVLSPVVATHWLRADGLGTERLVVAIMLMGLVIACRWPAQLYQGAIMGAQRIVISSALNVAWVILGSGGAVLLLAFVSPSIEIFLLWQSGVGLAYAFAARAASWRVVGRESVKYDRRQLERIWRVSAGLTGITVTGIALSQVDKVVLSKMLSLSEYGEYMLAVAIAGTLYLISIPLFNVVFPRFSTLVYSGDIDRMAGTYRLSARLLGAIVFPVAMFFSVFPVEIVQAWTGNPSLAQHAGLILPALAVGTALHSVMYVPYALQLAHGMTRLPLTINAILLLIVVPLTIALASAYGALGGALAWLILHALYLVLGTWLTHRRLLKGLGPKWLALDVGVPLAISALVGLLAFNLPVGGDLGVYARVGCGVAWAVVAFALTIAASPTLRAAAVQYIREWVYKTPQGRAT
ncbi:MAG TPA: oligosaccharide flippase family protein [Burkholderiales bacterium]|nr:oligosaccharide flippase family protein [Burkholderiales bacterium]